MPIDKEELWKHCERENERRSERPSTAPCSADYYEDLIAKLTDILGRMPYCRICEGGNLLCDPNLYNEAVGIINLHKRR